MTERPRTSPLPSGRLPALGPPHRGRGALARGTAARPSPSPAHTAHAGREPSRGPRRVQPPGRPVVSADRAAPCLHLLRERKSARSPEPVSPGDGGVHARCVPLSEPEQEHLQPRSGPRAPTPQGSTRAAKCSWLCPCPRHAWAPSARPADPGAAGGTEQQCHPVPPSDCPPDRGCCPPGSASAALSGPEPPVSTAAGRGQFPDRVVQCGAAARRGPVGAARGPAAGWESAREPRSPPCPPPSTGCARPAKNLAVTGRWTLRAALGEDAGSDTRSHDRTHSDQTRWHHRLPAGHGDSKCVCDGQTTSLPKKSKENGSLPPKKSLKTSSGFRNVKPNSKGPSK